MWRTLLALAVLALTGCAAPATVTHRDPHGGLWQCPATPGDCTLLEGAPAKVDWDGLEGAST